MASKTQRAVPPSSVYLETIYEESGGSFSSFAAGDENEINNHKHLSRYDANQTFRGLISARSMPTVHGYRRRKTTEYQQKPPVEVRYRDGTKRYIHPSLTATPTSRNQRKYSHTSPHDSSKINAKSRQIFNAPPKKKKVLPERPSVILTIITAEDLNHAGVASSSTSSLEESDALALTKLQSNSPLDTPKAVKHVSLNDIDKAPTEQLSVATLPSSTAPVQPTGSASVSDVSFSAAPQHHSQFQSHLRHPQEMDTVRSQGLSLPQSRLYLPRQQKSVSNQVPPVDVMSTDPTSSASSLEVIVKNDTHEQNVSSNVNLPAATTSSSRTTNESTSNQHKVSLQPSTAILVGGGSRSAFRPFLKPASFLPELRMPFNKNVRSQIAANQDLQNSSKQQITSFSNLHVQQNRLKSLFDITNFIVQPSSSVNSLVYQNYSMNCMVPKQPTNLIVSNHMLSDKGTNIKSEINTTFKNTQQLTQLSTGKTINNTYHEPSISSDRIKDVQNHELITDSSLQWHSIESKSLRDVFHLSHKYSDMPLQITLPDGSPTHNQKLLNKHDLALEKRLSKAGLSPETVALYERILEAADIRQMAVISLVETVDQHLS